MKFLRHPDNLFYFKIINNDVLYNFIWGGLNHKATLKYVKGCYFCHSWTQWLKVMTLAKTLILLVNVILA